MFRCEDSTVSLLSSHSAVGLKMSCPQCAAYCMEGMIHPWTCGLTEGLLQNGQGVCAYHLDTSAVASSSLGIAHQWGLWGVQSLAFEQRDRNYTTVSENLDSTDHAETCHHNTVKLQGDLGSCGSFDDPCSACGLDGKQHPPPAGSNVQCDQKRALSSRNMSTNTLNFRA